MDVTKSNLKELLPEIKSSIDNATFLAVDCEFSGLNSDVKLTCFDSHKTYYNKIRQGANDYIIIQFGLCAFRFDEETESFKQKCYNFYIFPRRNDRSEPERRFLCQASSIDFLVGNNFDFNKLFREGITYLNREEEQKCLEILIQKQKQRETNMVKKDKNNQNVSNVSVPNNDREFLETIIKSIEDFIETDAKEIQLPKCNAFLRRLTYQTAQDRFDDDVALETRTDANGDRILFATKTTTEERLEKEKIRRVEELQRLKDNIGFSVVVQHISESGKLIIGHNFLLDIMHTVDKFITPVPSEYEEFKECVHCIFPNIVDTKYMASTFPFCETIKSSILENVFNVVKQEPYALPTVEIEHESRGYSTDDNKQHEAGYDAFITGMCFLGMCQYLVKLDKKSEEKFVLPGSSKLRPFLNRICLMKIQDCPYINLEANDDIPPRDHVLHVTFPNDWKTSDLLRLFSPYDNVYVGWIDDVSAYVELSSAKKADEALHALKHGNEYTVSTYRKYQETLEENVEITKKRPTVIAITKLTSNLNTGDKNDGIKEKKTKKRTRSESKEIPNKKKTFMEESAWE